MTNIRDETPPGYVIPLSTDGSELLSFEPREHASGWAVYFPNGDSLNADDAGELVLQGANIFVRVAPRANDAATEPRPIADDEPLEIREVRVLMVGNAALRSAVLRSVPQDRIEAAINQPKHRKALAKYVMPGSVVADDIPGTMGAWLFRPLEAPVLKLPDLRLEIPDGYRKPDEFYRAVGELFLELAAVSTRAAQEIAEANGIKPTTVHRWIREAKARGLLILPAD